MEDLNKNVKTEKPIVEQNGLNKEATENVVITAPTVPAKRIRVRAKTNPAPAIVAKKSPVAAVEISRSEVKSPKAAKPAVTKVKKTEEKIVLKKAPKMEKPELEPKVQNVISAISKNETVKPELDKKEIKIIKKKAKKAEEKVDKLKKKVKKAKKKDVKKSKLKSLKEKLGKALKRLKIKGKELEK